MTPNELRQQAIRIASTDPERAYAFMEEAKQLEASVRTAKRYTKDQIVKNLGALDKSIVSLRADLDHTSQMAWDLGNDYTGLQGISFMQEESKRLARALDKAQHELYEAMNENLLFLEAVKKAPKTTKD